MSISGQEEKDARTEEILEYYGGLPDRSAQENIVNMLRELQDVRGCIDPSALAMAAEAAGVGEPVIRAILKRYPSLKTAACTHEIVLCVGRNCAARGNLRVLEELKKKLGIGRDGISRDGKVCLKTRSCLKRCRRAPNLMLDGRVISGLDADAVLRMLDEPAVK